MGYFILQKMQRLNDLYSQVFSDRLALLYTVASSGGDDVCATITLNLKLMQVFCHNIIDSEGKKKKKNQQTK